MEIGNIEDWLRWLIDIDQSNRVIVKFQADLFLKLVSIYSFELLTSRILKLSRFLRSKSEIIQTWIMSLLNWYWIIQV